MNIVNTHSVEMASGKNEAYENFPVGSWLLPVALRPHIGIFYAFARAADDIADSPDLLPEEKLTRLNGFVAALTGQAGDHQGYEKGLRMRDSLAATGVASRHCVDLLAAFKQDATKTRYRNWQDLIGYCQLSAAPVGRYLIDLHGGSKNGYGPSDALCIALQILNHLQDCQEDYLTLDRVYLPMDILSSHQMIPEALDDNHCSPALRLTIDQCLDGVDDLMQNAALLPDGLRNKRLAMESAIIIAIANTLSRKLRSADPLSQRVKLNKVQYAYCCLAGMWRGLF